MGVNARQQSVALTGSAFEKFPSSRVFVCTFDLGETVASSEGFLKKMTFLWLANSLSLFDWRS